MCMLMFDAACQCYVRRISSVPQALVLIHCISRLLWCGSRVQFKLTIHAHHTIVYTSSSTNIHGDCRIKRGIDRVLRTCSSVLMYWLQLQGINDIRLTELVHEFESVGIIPNFYLACTCTDSRTLFSHTYSWADFSICFPNGNKYTVCL